MSGHVVIQSNITLVLGEDIFSLKIQYGILSYSCMFQVEICSQQLEPIFLLQLLLCGTHGIFIYFHQLNIAHER